MGQAGSNAVFRAQIRWFLQNAIFWRIFGFWPKKGPRKKKFNKNAWLYFMNFDYLSYESNLLFLGHPHICERGGGAEPLHCIPSIGVYIYTYDKYICIIHTSINMNWDSFWKKNVGWGCLTENIYFEHNCSSSVLVVWKGEDCWEGEG